MPRVRINGRVWFAMDANGVWWWYSRKPRMADGYWTLKAGSVAQVPTGLIVLPQCERRDWRKSLFKANGERDDGRIRRARLGASKAANVAG